MNMLLTRRTFTDNSVTGDLTIDGTFFCHTLERPWKDNAPDVSCIPEGTYKVVLDVSARHHQLWPHILDVRDRLGVRIDIANFPNQLEGCIAVGKTLGQDCIWNSGEAWHELFGMLQKAKEGTLTIKKEG